MTKQSDIFKGLKEHGITPPGGVKEKLFHMLNTDRNAFSPSSEHASLDGTVSSAPPLGFLQEYAVPPPGDAFGALMSRIAADSKKKRRLYTRMYRFGAVAACLLLALVGWGLYRMSHPPLRQPPGLAKTQSSPASGANTPGPTADTSARAANEVNATADRTPPASDSGSATPVNADRQAAGSADNYFRNTRVRVDGQAFTLVDNDLLVTLTSFHYDEIPGFLTHDNDNTDTKIQVDQYSAITVSPEMQKMMKKMYTYRSGGVPIRRARKERERLLDWKKADESRFDGKNGKNPLNPFDLATFIFK